MGYKWDLCANCQHYRFEHHVVLGCKECRCQSWKEPEHDEED